MPEHSEQINIVELLMKIKEDVSSIKTDMANFKEIQRTEKETIMKAIADVRADYKRDISTLENCVMSRITSMQSVNETLVKDVNTLKHADVHKDARKWHKVIAFIATAIGGVVLAKIPEFINYIIGGK